MARHSPLAPALPGALSVPPHTPMSGPRYHLLAQYIPPPNAGPCAGRGIHARRRRGLCCGTGAHRCAAPICRQAAAHCNRLGRVALAAAAAAAVFAGWLAAPAVRVACIPRLWPLPCVCGVHSAAACAVHAVVLPRRSARCGRIRRGTASRSPRLWPATGCCWRAWMQPVSVLQYSFTSPFCDKLTTAAGGRGCNQ